ncbi:hypothetical protein CJF30_00011054 [Rutstroemia sp. NJR-2017a BBW]|nr:hypothetical protein CJF30_00011054 [Rutstroemia sp. NJR-2017a BBW]
MRILYPHSIKLIDNGIALENLRRFRPKEIPKQEKIQLRIEESDPIRKAEFDEWVNASRRVQFQSTITQSELEILRKKHHDDLKVRTTARTRVKPLGKPGNGLILEDALEKMREKEAKAQELEDRKTRNAWLKHWHVERDDVKARGAIARRLERERRNIITECNRTGKEVPTESPVEIEDP